MSGLDDLLEGPPKHLERYAPPWVTSQRTICGRQLDDVSGWLSFEEAKTLINKLGETRARLVLCQTCLNQHRKIAGPATWGSVPAQVTYDWVQRGLYGQNPEADEIRALLLSLGRLVEAHRDEFNGMANAYLTDEVSSRRKKRSEG